MLKDALIEVENNILDACERSGRNPEEVTLIAVSKTKPVEMLQEVYNEGIRDFGENYVQELADKIEIMPKDIRWHMIGHLQRNKVKYLVGKVACIHSVDSLRLAEVINERSIKLGVVTKIMAEVNIAGEESKFGFTRDEVFDFAEKVSTMEGVKLVGLMTSAPYVNDPEENRQYFREMKSLSVDINEKNINNINITELSMGMTNDYIVAVEEGATHVRVGTAIFGARNYS
ncbi:MAG: YggS family pyridoxal phosphate-dependent enzyme [Lachnospiraceae bacterium]|nr:YggS family pyridoxal phosphate-dependent enzyme [Lachnospiraceae bacterium]